MDSVVTTESVARADRFDHWAHEMEKVFGGLDSRPATEAPFRGRATSSTVGLLRFASIDAGPLMVRRGARAAAAPEKSHYKVAVQIAGECVVEQDGVSESLAPGDIAICDTSRPYTFAYPGDFRTVLMLLPRLLLPVRPETVRSITARRLTSKGGVGAVVGPFLRSLGAQAGTRSDAAALNLMDGATSLVTALVSEKLAEAAPSVPQQALMARIRMYIEKRLSHPGLTPDSIAEAHCISRRYLFKLFAAEGLTVAGWIRTRRLERCARDLAGAASAELSISMIAARWGLLDCRHFSRVFKSVYGETPRDYRRRALTGLTTAR
ncbi:helix-turn-helix domain-containing protein [Streptomyces olivaceus]|uniref:AraC-like ligand-binding domain-containing protein n=1 Tax=Streptomyces olivaceus TaxID=47716 RepID=UPI001CCC4EE2|nr:helix-turn-helix domain-containing protein [Streptomyces olivaceus]MBZ6083704.1 helix-turn-helix domain-containing protein [Streptomyces olivaceus]